MFDLKSDGVKRSVEISRRVGGGGRRLLVLRRRHFLDRNATSGADDFCGLDRIGEELVEKTGDETRNLIRESDAPHTTSLPVLFYFINVEV